MGKCSEEVIKDQMQLFRRVSEELANKVQDALAQSEPPKPEPKPAQV